MKVNILHKEDTVVNVTDKFIVIKKQNGEVKIVPFLKCETGLEVDLKNIITIGFCENVIEVELEKDDVTIINF